MQRVEVCWDAKGCGAFRTLHAAHLSSILTWETIAVGTKVLHDLRKNWNTLISKVQGTSSHAGVAASTVALNIGRDYILFWGRIFVYKELCLAWSNHQDNSTRC